MYKKLLIVKRKCRAIGDIINFIAFCSKNAKSHSRVIDYELAKIIGILDLNWELNDNRILDYDDVRVLLDFIERTREIIS